MTPKRFFEVPDVLEVHVVPSEDVRMVPEDPTARNRDSVVFVSSVVEPLDVVLLLVSLFLAQEMTVRLIMDMRIMYKTLFIFFLHRNERN